MKTSPIGKKPLLKVRNVSGSSFADNDQKKLMRIIDNQNFTINFLSKKFFAIEKEISFLKNSIAKEAKFEQIKQRKKEIQSLKTQENNARRGEETAIEGSLSRAVSKPTKSIVKKTESTLSNLVTAFRNLFLGWLANKGFDAFDAYTKGDFLKLEDIKNKVLGNLAIIGGIFLALNGGIFVILGIIGKIIKGIAKISWNFLKAIVNRVRNVFRPRPQSNTGGRPRGGTSGGGTSGGGTSGGGRTQLAVSGRGATSSGNQSGVKGRSSFDLEQQRKAITQQNMMRDDGPKNIFDSGRRFIKQQLEQFSHTKGGRGLTRVIKHIKNSWVGKVAGFFIDKYIKAFEAAKNFFKPKTIQNIGKGLARAGVLTKVLGKLLGPLLAVIDIHGRANSGMSPAQAIIPAVLKALLTSGAAILGGMVPIPGLNILTSIAGSFAGSWLGDRIMEGIDSMWDKSWDKNLFSGFNDFVMNLGKGDNPLSKKIGEMFPYEGVSNYGQETAAASSSPPAAAPSPPAAAPSPPAAAPSPPSAAPSPPAAAPSAPSISPTTPSMSAPGPVSSSGNTTVIYKKVSSGGRSGNQPLKKGSATNTPAISSSNPENFYTMYSQVVYNVI